MRLFLSLLFLQTAVFCAAPNFKWISQTLSNPNNIAWSVGSQVSPIFCWRDQSKAPDTTDYLVLRIKRSNFLWPFATLINDVVFDRVGHLIPNMRELVEAGVGDEEVCYAARFTIPDSFPPSVRYILQVVDKRSEWFFFNTYFPWSPKFTITSQSYGQVDQFFNRLDEMYRHKYDQCVAHIQSNIDACYEYFPKDGSAVAACKRYVRGQCDRCSSLFTQAKEIIQQKCGGVYEKCSLPVKSVLQKMKNNILQFCRDFSNVQNTAPSTPQGDQMSTSSFYFKRNSERTDFSQGSSPRHPCGSLPDLPVISSPVIPDGQARNMPRIAAPVPTVSSSPREIIQRFEQISGARPRNSGNGSGRPPLSVRTSSLTKAIASQEISDPVKPTPPPMKDEEGLMGVSDDESESSRRSRRSQSRQVEEGAVEEKRSRSRSKSPVPREVSADITA